MKFSIRPAVAADAGAIARVHVDAWRNAYPMLLPDTYLAERLSEARQRTAWRHRLQSARGGEAILVATAGDGTIVGYIAFGRCRRRGMRAMGEIYDLYVAPDYQDHGAGRGLAIAARARMQEAGTGPVAVEVLAGNPARFFYERLGAAISGTATQTFAGQRLDTLLYIWNDSAPSAHE
jgi:ribosomal protein S18 acetylase RimI-like enzyme